MSGEDKQSQGTSKVSGVTLEVNVAGAVAYRGSKGYGRWVSHVEVLLAELCTAQVWLDGRPITDPADDSFNLMQVAAASRTFGQKGTSGDLTEVQEHPWTLLKLKNLRRVPATSTQGRRVAGGPTVHQIGTVPAGQDGVSNLPSSTVGTNTVHLSVQFSDGVKFVGQGGPYPSMVFSVDHILCTDTGATATVHLVLGGPQTVTLTPSP